MAPPDRNAAQYAKGVIHYMDLVSQQTSSRYDKKIARSCELKSFLLHLSERAPSAMNGPLGLASRKCEDALRVEQETQLARKRVASPSHNERDAKRHEMGPKIICDAGEETIQQRQMDNMEDCPKGKEISTPQSDLQCSKVALPEIRASEKNGQGMEECSKYRYPDTSVAYLPQEETIQQGQVDDEEDYLKENELFITQSISQYDKGGLPDTPNFDKDGESREAYSKYQDPSTRTTCDAGEETFYPGEVDVEEDCLEEDESSRPQRNSQYSETALPDTLAFEKDGESGEEYSQYRDLNSKPAGDKLLSMAMTSTCVRPDGKTDVSPTDYEIESGLSCGLSNIIAFVKACLLDLKPSTIRTNSNIHDEIENVWIIILLLDFFQVKRELYAHLESRGKVPRDQLQIRTDWNTTDLGKILDALKNVKRSTIDNKIHRAYGQILLVWSVDAKVARGYKSTVTGHRTGHMAILEEVAHEKAGSISKRELGQLISDYIYEYHAGQKWLAIIEWFGGSGIVLVFVIAGK